MDRKVEAVGATAEAAIDDAREVIKKIDEVKQEAEGLIKASKVALEKQGDSSPSLDTQSDQLSEYLRHDRLLQWLNWSQMVTKLEKEAREAVDKDEAQEADEAFKKLSSVALKIKASKCDNLRSWTLKTAYAARKRALMKLETRLEADLEQLNYPKCIVSEDVPIGKLTLEAGQDVQRLKVHFLLMIEIGQMGKDFVEEGEEEEESSYPRPSDVMLAPLRKRFKYHFLGKKKTNNLVRPEWYLQQLMRWIKRSQVFFDTCVATRHRLATRGVSGEMGRFFEGVLQLATDKLRVDLGELQEDDVILSHVIDEVLSFTKDVNELEYLKRKVPQECLPVSVLSQDSVCNKWLLLERKYAFEKIDTILLEGEGWQQSPSNPDIYRCVEAFITLLQSLTARFKPMYQVNIKLRFLDLISELLEDFRMRLVKMLQSESTELLSKSYALTLNSAHFLIGTLETWRELPLFLHLGHLQQETGESGGLFTTVLDGLNFIIKDSTHNLSQSITFSVKAQSLAYRRDVDRRDFECIYGNSPCPESLGMFQALSSSLNTASQHLKAEIMSRVVSRVSRELSDFFLDDVVLQCEFNPEAARQLEMDVRLGVLPILQQFALPGEQAEIRPVRLIEACKLLNCPAPTALLVHDSLLNCDSINEAKVILAEHDVANLSGSMARQILTNRLDIAHY